MPLSFRRLIFRLFDPIQSIDMNVVETYKEVFPDEQSYESYFLNENMPKKISKLKSDLDEDSCQLIDQKLDHLLNFPSMWSHYQKNIRCLDRNEILYNPNQIQEQKKFLKSLNNIKKELRLRGYSPEVVYYHHGLKLLPQSFHQYIKDSVIVDCGASYGDSAVVFQKYYSPSKVVSYDLATDKSSATETYFRTIDENNLDNSQFEFIPYGVGSKSRIFSDGKLDGAELVTIDESLDHNNIRLIKMDIEGSAYDAISGALQVIRDNRPILILSCYHSPREFFELKPFIDDSFDNYKFKFLNLNFVTAFELETVLIAFPAEL